MSSATAWHLTCITININPTEPLSSIELTYMSGHKGTLRFSALLLPSSNLLDRDLDLVLEETDPEEQKRWRSEDQISFDYMMEYASSKLNVASMSLQRYFNGIRSEYKNGLCLEL